MGFHDPRIAVVGAGLGGLICARTLQRHGHAVTVFERDTGADARMQGGMLDLQTETGQTAMRTAGLFDEYLSRARPEGQEMRAVDPVSGTLLHHEMPSHNGHSAPEIDRGLLRSLLLESLSPATVHWDRPVRSVTPRDGTARVYFAADGYEDFDLVIGADGAWSRTRRALSTATPTYTGDTFVESVINDIDTAHPDLAALVGPGTLIAKAGDTVLVAMRLNRGRLGVYVQLRTPYDWYADTGVDLADAAAVRTHLLTRLDGWDPQLRDLVRRSAGDYVNRPLHVLPVGHAWDHMPGVTLLGDAAHLMPPYGVGANLALLDGTDLAIAIAAGNDLDAAVQRYEGTMLPRAAAAAAACAELATAMGTAELIDVDAMRTHIGNRLASGAGR